jgi:hypothetical protein
MRNVTFCAGLRPPPPLEPLRKSRVLGPAAQEAGCLAASHLLHEREIVLQRERERKARLEEYVDRLTRLHAQRWALPIDVARRHVLAVAVGPRKTMMDEPVQRS